MALIFALSLISTNAYAVNLQAKRVDIEDTGSNFTATTVEAALAELAGSSAAEVQDQTYNSTNFNADTTHAVSQDDLYDLIHLFDTDDDGLPNKIDTTTNGIVLTGSGDGTLSITATLDASYLATDSVSADELNATGVESELEAVLDLESLQGAVTDGQVPNNITIDLATASTNVSDADKGDITIALGVWSVEDESHAHTTTTISGLDVSADTNLTAGDNLTLTDDDLDLDATVTIATSILSPIFSSTTSDPADAGILRFANAEGIAWEASPAGTDVTMTLDTSEIVQIANGTLDGGDLTSASVTATQLGTDSVSADELNATGVEAELEAVLDLQEIQGAVIDSQVPNTITIDLATLASTSTVVDGTDATSFPLIVDSATGSLAIKTDGGLLYAADTGTLSATVLTEGANAVYNSGETPGGELGGTWATPTIDDTLAVTDWNLTTPTITTQFTLTAQATPTTDGDGEVALDTDGWGTGFDAFEIFNGTASAYLVATTASDTPSNGEVPKWNTGGSITWEADSGGAEVNNLETIATGIATTEIPIGTAADTIVYAALSGQATMTNAGVVTVNDVTCTNCLTTTEVASADLATVATNVSDADFGEVTVASGSWTIDDGMIESEHFGDDDWGDVTIASNVASVEDDSHAHTTTTISGLVNANLSGSAGITLANTAITAGRSVTIATNDILADPELYTDTKCIYFENPVAADDFKSIWLAPSAVTLTKIWAESDQTVTFMLQVDDGTPADVDSVDLAPAIGTAEDTSLDGDTTMAAGDRLDLATTSVANTPTSCSICWTFTYDD